MYRKKQEGRFLSHLDLVRTMQRIFRRANLPLAYSEGFNPHPKLSYGSALAVGVTSDGEYLDVELKTEIPLEQLKEKLGNVMPPGLEILEIMNLGDRKGSLTAIINLARYQVEVLSTEIIDQSRLDQVIETLLAKESLEVMRRGKKGLRSVDIRNGIYDLHGSLINNTVILEMDLQTGSEGNVRPEEVVTALKDVFGFEVLFADQGISIHRVGLFVRSKDNIVTAPNALPD